MESINFASQFVFVLAAVLFVSSISKLIDLPKPKFLDFPINNALLAKFNSITANKIIIFIFVVVEMILSILILIFAGIDSNVRQIALILASVLFLIFTIWTFLLFVFKSGQPCLCFGALSKKRVRLNTVIRNALLTSMAFVAIFSDPQSLNFLGLALSIFVLSIILLEEIR